MLRLFFRWSSKPSYGAWICVPGVPRAGSPVGRGELPAGGREGKAQRGDEHRERKKRQRAGCRLQHDGLARLLHGGKTPAGPHSMGNGHPRDLHGGNRVLGIGSAGREQPRSRRSLGSDSGLSGKLPPIWSEGDTAQEQGHVAGTGEGAPGFSSSAHPPAPPRHRGNAAGGDPMALRADGEAKRPGAHGHHPRRRPERTALRPTASVTCWAGVLWAPLGNGGGMVEGQAGMPIGTGSPL